jgi:xylan 1,4-beta-xylosidase
LKKKKHLINLIDFLVLVAIGPVLTPAVCETPEVFDVKIVVDVSLKQGKISPIWRFFGADEPNYAYMKKKTARRSWKTKER